MKLYSKRIWISGLEGFASSLPLALTGGTLQAWMATEKVELKTIGWFSTLVALPYAWKFAWSWIFDRYPTEFLGPRRGWILIFQMLLLLSVFALGTLAPQSQLALVASTAILITFFSASQDTVIDAYRADLLLPEERGPGAALTTIFARIGALTAGSLSLILADHISFGKVYFCMSLLMLVGIVATALGPEPEALLKKISDKRPTLKQSVVEPFREFLRRPGSWFILLFVILYKFGDAFSLSLATPFLLNVGYTKTEIGTAFKLVGMIGALLGAAAGGSGVAKIGITRSLFVFGALQAVSNLGFLWIAVSEPNIWLLGSAIGFDQFCGGLGTAAFLAFLMALCNARYTATQYALLSSAASFARIFISTPAGWIAQEWGWPSFFVISIVVATPALGLLLISRKKFDIEKT